MAKRGYIVGLLTTETGLSPSHPDFAQDLLFIHNKLIAENSNSASFFYQHVTNKGAIGGHSMGGGSTVLSAQYGNPQTCCFTFSAATTNPSSITAAHLMTKPYLSFAGSKDCIAPIATNQQPMYDSSGSACKFLINITNGLHCQYGNANTACSFGEGVSGCALSTLTRQQQIDKTLFYLLPFLDYYLKGDCSAWTLFENRYTTNTVDALQRNCTNTIPSNASIAGNNFFCNGNSTSLTALPSGFQYLWSDNSTVNPINVNTAGAYSVVVGNGTCSLSAVSVSVSENFSPATPSAITAPDTVCSNISSINISVVNDSSATTYNWVLPAGWSITSGNNTHAVQTNSGTSGGTISVTAQNSCGTTSPSTKQIVVVPSTLGNPGTITGADTVCVSQNTSYSITPVSGADTYQWNFPAGWNITSGSNTNSVQVNAGTGSGSISVSAVNSCGQSIPSAISVIAHTIPVLGVIYGSDTVCLNDYTPLNFSLSSVSDADSIVWSVSNPWNIISGQGSSTVNVNSFGANGTAYVYGANQCGAASAVSFVSVYVDTPQITVTQQGALLHADAVNAISYQWYNNGALISNATAADYTPTATGNYTVSVTNSVGCTSQSSAFSFVFTDVGNESFSKNYLSVYPNPTNSNKILLQVSDDLIGSSFSLFNAIGSCVFRSVIVNQNFEINLPSLSSGIYLLQVENATHQLTRKLVVE
jgi:hypothetical protein